MVRNQTTLTENNQPIVALLDRLTVSIGIVFIFLFPLFYLTSTTEFVEYPKIVLTMCTATVLLALWSIRALVSKKFTLVRTPFDMFFLLIGVAFVLTTWQSVSVNTSLFGEFNIWHWTLAEFLALIVIFYILATAVQTTRAFYRLVAAFLISSVIVAGISLVSYLNLLDGIVQRGGLSSLRMLQLWAVDGFSPAGNAFSAIYVLGVAFVLFVFMFRYFMKARNDAAAATNTAPSMVLSLVGLLITGLALVAWLGQYLPVIPARVTMPVNLDLTESWRIASSAVRDNALFGTGPSTYSTAYRAYRSTAINQTDSWNLVFHNSGSEYLTWMTTMGLVGIAALVLLVVRIIATARKNIASMAEGQQSTGTVDPLISAIKLPIVLIVLGTLVLFLFMSSTVAIAGVFFIVLTLWMLVNKLDESTDIVEEVNLNLQLVSEKLLPARGKTFATDESDQPQYLPLFIGVALFIIAGVGGYYTLRDVQSNLAFAQSAQHLANNAPVRDIYDAQRAAIQYNPRRDAYRRAYANTNISVAQLVASERGESLTDTERQDVVTLIQQAIREVRIITEVLYPTNALNWQIRGRVYQSLLGVARGADTWALHAFQQAIILAPQDPQLRVDLGGLFLRLAIEAPIEDGTQGDPPGNEIPSAPDTRATNLLRAEAAFQDAIRLKPDFANGHFNLAVLYQEAGRYDLAIRELEATLGLVSPDSNDYQQASDLLEEVRRLSEQGNLPEPELPDPIEVEEEEDVQETFTPTETPTAATTPVPTATPTPLLQTENN